MPLYGYYCGECLKTYEILIPLDKYEDKVYCPHCGKELKKLISPVMFVIK